MTPAERRAIQRKLDRWELGHLRHVAAALAEQLEALTEQIDALEQRAYDAERRADMFHGLTMQLEEGSSSHQCIGLSRDGAMMVVDRNGY